MMDDSARASMRRHSKRVQKIEATARLKYQSQLETNSKKQEEISQKLREVQIKREGNTARIILTPEQQQAIKDLERQQVDQKKNAREILRNLRHAADAL